MQPEGGEVPSREGADQIVDRGTRGTDDQDLGARRDGSEEVGRGAEPFGGRGGLQEMDHAALPNNRKADRGLR